MPKHTTLRSYRAEIVNCLWLADGVLTVGTMSRSPQGGSHHLERIDASSGKLLARFKTPYLVSHVAVAAGFAHASLGPGYYGCWQLGDKAGPSFEQIDANAVRFAVWGDELWWGTFWGEIHQWRRGLVAQLRKDLSGVSVDDDYVAAGYRDGACRVFDKDSGKRHKVLRCGRGWVSCAMVGDGTLITVADRSRQAQRWRLTDGELLDSFEASGRPRVFGERLVLLGRVGQKHPVQVLDLSGEPIARCSDPDDEEVNDAWLEGERLWTAAGTRVVVTDLG